MDCPEPARKRGYIVLAQSLLLVASRASSELCKKSVAVRGVNDGEISEKLWSTSESVGITGKSK